MIETKNVGVHSSHFVEPFVLLRISSTSVSFLSFSARAVRFTPAASKAVILTPIGPSISTPINEQDDIDCETGITN